MQNSTGIGDINSNIHESIENCEPRNKGFKIWEKCHSVNCCCRIKNESAAQSLVVSELKNETSELREKSTRLQNNYDSLQKKFGALQNENSVLKHVAITSCTSSSVDYQDAEIIKFPSTKTSIGINSLTEFQNTGKFICEKAGVYLFAVYITYYGNYNADFELKKNNQRISIVMIVYGTHAGGNYYSGSGTVVVQMNAGDILFAEANRHMTVAGSYNCFTVLKIF
ncbi:unnamed protein product [Mytilus coruscus]|uniref:C1q domain-containing protein n=1 Tax=Mytilus coruscus TaxID=42192 RepID=A0A6J8BNH6_MYTCO|nr:unnamed protein product [Mytilus coruscus]